MITLLIALLLSQPGYAFERILGNYVGRTERATTCDVRVQRLGEVHITISTISGLTSQAFSSIQLQDQWQRSTREITLQRLGGDVYEVTTSAATLTLDEERNLTSVSLRIRQQDIFGQERIKTLRCRSLVKN